MCHGLDCEQLGGSAEGTDAATLFGTEMIPPGPLYILSAGSVAVALILCALELTHLVEVSS